MKKLFIPFIGCYYIWKIDIKDQYEDTSTDYVKESNLFYTIVLASIWQGIVLGFSGLGIIGLISTI